MKRISLIVAVGMALLAQPMDAQERLGSGAPDLQYRAGWTFTPTIGVGETYDTNVSLFSQGHAANEDYISTVYPGADLHYAGKQSTFELGYSGTFLDYRRFGALNRWDQRAKFELRHHQSARLAW